MKKESGTFAPMPKFDRSLKVRSLLLLFLALSGKLLSAAEGKGEKDEGTGPSDTVNPNLGAIFEKTPLTLSYLDRVKDSLSERKQKVSTPLNYLERPVPKKERILGMIDTLLDGDEVDEDRMRGIRVLIARLKAKRRAPFTIPYDASPYPASKFLKTWDTERIAPYPRRMESEKKELRLVAPEWECGFQVPVEGEVTSSYGIRKGRAHTGIDLDLHTGDPVRASFPGMVRIARYFQGYGRVVLIRHPNGLETLYAHLHRSGVEPGERVEAGERIGEGGSTGHSTGSHLHFEVRFKGMPLNPSHFISFEEGELMGETLVVEKNDGQPAAYPKGTEFHEVERGDYLYRIAQRYGTTIRKICELNGIGRNSTLWVGQRLRVSH